MAGCYALTQGGAVDAAALDHALEVAQAYAETEEKACEERLQIQGSRVHRGIKELLAGTRWASGQIVRVIVGSNPYAYGIKAR